MELTYRVQRPFEADGRMLTTGETVEAGAWRNLRMLLNQRYLVPVLAPPADEAPRRERGRKVSDAE